MSYLQIASWNIEHLSGASRAERKQSAYALTDHIEMAGIDIISLQEIYVSHEDNGRRRNEDLDRVCKLLEEHLGDPWEYLILPNQRADDKSQLCGVMWNANRVACKGMTRLPVSHKDGNHSLWDRAPHAVKFTMTMDVWTKDDAGKSVKGPVDKSLVVIPIHMKSNYGGSTVAKIVRHKEAITLCEQLPLIKEIDPSIVIIGDTNVLRYDEPAIETFVNNGLIDLNNTDGPTYWSKAFGESPFDRAFIAAGRKEFKYTRQYILRSSDLMKHDHFLSDHYMIKLSVKLYVDDADPRPAIETT